MFGVPVSKLLFVNPNHELVNESQSCKMIKKLNIARIITVQRIYNF